MVESEFEDFVHHFFTVGVARIIPAGGEGKHGNYFDQKWKLGPASGVFDIWFRQIFDERLEIAPSDKIEFHSLLRLVVQRGEQPNK